ncbi:MAG: hypothetical protein ABL959_00890 [Pyrinomonadaceae bacterium]
MNEVKSIYDLTTRPGITPRTSGARFGALLSCFCFFVIFFALPSVTSGQDDSSEVAPPPVKLLSKDERSRLDAKAVDLKARTKLALELMDARLDAAEKWADGRQFDTMFNELGGFHALMDDSIEFLNRRDSGSNGKILDNFKRLEIGLRAFSPRIEVIRRELPIRYDDYVRRLMKFVRDARTRATEPLFSDTVVPNRKNGNNL